MKRYTDKVLDAQAAKYDVEVRQTTALSALRVARRKLEEAEAAVAEARMDLNAEVKRARHAAITVQKVMETVGWKQPKSVYDALKAYDAAMEVDE